MPKIRWPGSYLAFALAIVVGCGYRNDPLAFISSIKQLSKNWRGDVTRFSQLIKAENNPDKLQAEHKDLIARIKTLVAESKSIDVPAGQHAQELWNAFQTYLQDQEKIVTDDFRELIAIKSSSPPDMDQYWMVLRRCQQVENEDLARLRKVEEAYATANGIPP